MAEGSDDKKYTINIPHDVNEHFLKVQEDLKLKTITGTFALGIELLHWIVQVQNEGFEVKAEKIDEKRKTTVIQKLPLIVNK